MPTHHLIKGDSLKALPKLGEEGLSVDAVIVDPPYNTANKNTKVLKGRKARSSDFGAWDYYTDDDYLNFSREWISKTAPLLKESGNLAVFCKLEYVSDIRRIYESEGFKHHGTIIWHKTNPAPQIRKTGFLSSCEAILWATKGFDAKKVGYTFNFSKQNEMHNFVESPICMGKERTPHPTQKPKKIISHLVRIFTNENDWILDCFAGSGTLAEAANEMGRNSINIESENEYFKIMKKRLSESGDELFQKKQIIVAKNLKEISLLRQNA